ncbi:type II toxin-antitoxin system HicB family antitoxin [Breznakiellaceae bacterium SP9]
MKYTYQAIFTTDDDGTVCVKVPDLPGCITEGKTIQEALAMIEDAMAFWLTLAEDEYEQIPVSSYTSDGSGIRVSVDTDAWREASGIPGGYEEALAMDKTMEIRIDGTGSSTVLGFPTTRDKVLQDSGEFYDNG